MKQAQANVGFEVVDSRSVEIVPGGDLLWSAEDIITNREERYTRFVAPDCSREIADSLVAYSALAHRGRYNLGKHNKQQIGVGSQGVVYGHQGEVAVKVFWTENEHYQKLMLSHAVANMALWHGLLQTPYDGDINGWMINSARPYAVLAPRGTGPWRSVVFAMELIDGVHKPYTERPFGFQNRRELYDHYHAALGRAGLNVNEHPVAFDDVSDNLFFNYEQRRATKIDITALASDLGQQLLESIDS